MDLWRKPGADPKPHVLPGLPGVGSDFVGSKAYAILEALFKENNTKSQSNITDTRVDVYLDF